MKLELNVFKENLKLPNSGLRSSNFFFFVDKKQNFIATQKMNTLKEKQEPKIEN